MKIFINNPKFTLIQFPMIAIVVFVSLLLIGSQLYSGGTEVNSETVGYIFTENYISDLGRTTTHSGESNLFSLLIFIIVFSIMTFSLFTYFYGNYSFFKNKFHTGGNMFKLGTFFGMCFSLCFLGIALTPADINLKDHILFAEFLFRFLFGSSILLFLSFYKMHPSTRLLSFGYLLIAAATGTYIALSDFELNSMLFSNNYLAEVITQKLITISLLSGFVLVGTINNRILKEK